MSKQQKILLAVGLLAFLIISGGVFVNFLLDNMVKSLNSPPVDYSLLNQDPYSGLNGIDETVDEDIIDDPLNYETTSGDSNPVANNNSISNNTPPASTNLLDAGAANKDIVRDVQKKVDKPIDKKDLVDAGKIIIKKLSIEEIRYVYNVGKKDKYTKEELIKAREILTTNLTDEEIKTLRTLGGKYGKALRVLDVNVEIK